MRSPDDLDRVTDSAPAIDAGSVDSSVRDARSLGKVDLRLAQGGQVLGELHARRKRQVRRFVKGTFGPLCILREFGDCIPMGQRATGSEQGQKMTISEAAAASLRKAIPNRAVKAIAAEAGIPYTTLRRWRSGENKIPADAIDSLREIEGFSAEFDRLTANPRPEPDFMMAARLLSNAFDPDGAARIVQGAQALGLYMTADEIAKMLKEQANRLESVITRASDPSESARVGDKNSK